jgi:hypothetical protein
MKKLLVLALVLMAASACAQTVADPNSIGFYFDQTGTNNYSATASQAYLLATRISESSGIEGWEARVGVSGGIDPLSEDYMEPAFLLPTGSNNFGSPGNFIIGMTAVLPYAPAIRLARITVFNTDPNTGLKVPFSLYVGPAIPCSFGDPNGAYPNNPPSPLYAAGIDGGKLIGLTPSCNQPVPGMPNCFTVAASGMAAPPLPPFSIVIDINPVQVYTLTGVPASPNAGQTIAVRGVVTVASSAFADGAAYVQDATGGIAILPYLGLALGDSAIIQGTVSTSNGEILLAGSYRRSGATATPVAPSLLTIPQALDYEQVGMLVNVYGRVGALTSGDFRLEIGSTCLPVKIAPGISLGAVGLGDQYSVTGILRVVNGTIQLWARSQADLAEISSPYYFTLGIDAACAGSADNGSVLGTVYGATDGFDSALELPEPPHAPTGYLSAFFSHPEWGSPLGEGFQKDLRPDYDLNFEKTSWPFSVATDRIGTVSLTFSPSFTSNAGYDIVVEDLTEGTTTFLFPQLTYTYQSTVAGRRNFRLHVGRYYEVPAIAPAARSLTPGWSMLGIPLVPVTGQVTVGDILFDDTSSSSWVFDYLGASGYGLVASSCSWSRGHGLWLATLDNAAWDMQGVRDNGTTDIPLNDGWNMLGYPLWFQMPLANVRVVQGGNVYTYPQAVAANLVSGNVYGWDTATAQYTTAVNLDAWSAYWVAAYGSGISLRFNYRYLYDKAGALLAKADQTLVRTTSDDWRITLTLDDGRGVRAAATLGATAMATDGFDAAYDLPVPPASPKGPAPEIAFLHPEWQLSTGAALATDVRNGNVESQVWCVRLMLPEAGPVTLSWDPQAWPSDFDLNLYLPDQNRVVVRSMRALTDLALDVPAQGLVVELRTLDYTTGVSEGPTAVNLRAAPNPFNPLTEFRFDAPRAGVAEVRVFDARGRLVRALTAGQGPAGPRALRWDGCDAAGSVAASGLYFARVYLDGQPVGETIKASLVR